MLSSVKDNGSFAHISFKTRASFVALLAKIVSSALQKVHILANARRELVQLVTTQELGVQECDEGMNAGPISRAARGIVQVPKYINPGFGACTEDYSIK